MRHSIQYTRLTMIDSYDVAYRLLLCVFGTIAFAIITSTMAAYPHAHCR